MALTSEDYLLGLEKEIMGSDYYKILEINTKETKRRNNIEVLENIDEINDRISKIEENLNKISNEQKKEKNFMIIIRMLDIK